MCQIYLFLWLNNYPFYLYIAFCLSALFIAELLRWFYLLAVMYDAVINIHVQIFVCIYFFISCGYIPWSEIGHLCIFIGEICIQLIGLFINCLSYDYTFKNYLSIWDAISLSNIWIANISPIIFLSGIVIFFMVSFEVLIQEL